MSRESFTQNERTIIHLLRERDSLAKGDLCQLGEMSWATVVKLTNRLLERGILIVSGQGEDKKKPGKNAMLYSLAADRPLAIGFDVEYKSAHMVLSNLRGDILAESETATPQSPSVGELRSFLVKALKEFVSKHVAERKCTVGVGIGLPGGVIPAWLKPDADANRAKLENSLGKEIGLPVIVELNQRACTNFLLWQRDFFDDEDFGFVTIRNGVGMGLVLRGQVFVSHEAISTEIGHYKIAESGVRCRCGSTGCLEPLINQSALYAEYESRVLNRRPKANTSVNELVAGLHDLFDRAQKSEPQALTIIREMAVLLGRALSTCLLTVYVPNLIIGGYFGEAGNILLPMLEEQLRKNLLPNMRVNLRYISMERLPFAKADAVLALSAYLNQ